MKRTLSILRQALLISILLLLSLPECFASLPNAQPELPNFDRRLETVAKSATAPSQDNRAVAELKQQIPDARVDQDQLLGSSLWIASTKRFLTGPSGQGRAISAVTVTRFPTNDSHRVTKAFLSEHADLLGYGPEVLSEARVKRDYVGSHNGLHTTIWEQLVDGIPVFNGLLISHVTRKEELVSISSQFIPDASKAATMGTPNRKAMQASPMITAAKAVMKAMENLGENLAESELRLVNVETHSVEKHQSFSAASLKGDADVRLVWLPMNRTSMRLCWQVILMSKARGEMFKIIIDARTGEALLRHNLTAYISNASYRVFVTESPAPMSPGFQTPSTNQPALVSRVLVVTNAFNTNASPNGWINDGDNETVGNNVDAHLDRDGDDLPDVSRPRGAPFRVFDPPLDLSQDPAAYTDASVVNLFYWNNWMHDKLYEFGFTEASGNFQMNNFGRGGFGNDAVQADAQDGSGFNNANFSAPPDGLPGHLQMYLFNGPTPNRDGDLDTQIILHEYTHGLSGRLVGGGAGISALQSRGLGEGWSDFFSLALLSKSSDDLDANYPEGAYSTYQLFGLQENYYYGIRRYPYSTDMTKSPGTLRDIDPGLADPHTGVPRNPVILNSPTEIHNLGEIWCATLWDARANLIRKYGFDIGNQLVLQLITDALSLTPPNPDFIQARDAILQADLVDNGAVNHPELWAAFARRGMGSDASAPVSTTTSGVVESYDTPDTLLVTPPSDFSGGGNITGPFTPASQTYRLINTGTNDLNWAAGATMPWVDLSAAIGQLATNGGSTNILISLNNVASNLAVGTYTGTVAFTNLDTGFTSLRNFTLTITPPRLYFFSLDTDPGWSREGEWAFGVPLGMGGGSHGHPDPESGATGSNVFGVNLGGDYAAIAGGPYSLIAGPFNFADDQNVVLNFRRWLNSDYPPYASASMDVSTNGSDWITIFSNLGREVADSSWTSQLYDISNYADQQPSFYVRWNYEINVGAFAYSGWNIDDVEFLGVSHVSLDLPNFVSEEDGTITNAGQVRIAHAPASDIVVHLVSSDTSILTVPSTVVIPAGQTNGSFDITVFDNAILDGTKTISIEASAPGYINYSNSMMVLDNESATLSLSMPVSAVEGDGIIQGTITADVAPANDIAISLFSSDTNTVQLPETVTLPAGQTETFFSANIPDDSLINWDRNITITAHVVNWTDATANLLVHDNEDTNSNLQLPLQVRQSNGTITNAAKLLISNPAATNIIFQLTSSDTTKLTVPQNVIIPSGQTSAVFNLTLEDNNETNGTESVQVTADAAGFSNAFASVSVIDNQTPPVPIYLNPPNLSSNNPVLLQFSWLPGLGEGVERTVNGAFETGDLTGWLTNGSSNANLLLNDGTLFPPSGDFPALPFSGSYSLLAGQTVLPGFLQLSQEITLPTNSSSVILSWADKIRNFSDTFETNQQFRVEIRDTNDVVLAVPFKTQAGEPLLRDWTQRSIDITSFNGQTIRLAFVLEANSNYFDLHLDEISIRTGHPPLTAYDFYLGTNSVPEPSDLFTSTTNTSCIVSNLDSYKSYYWRVVARRGAATPGPTWQFSCLPTLFIHDISLREGDEGTTNATFSIDLLSGGDQTLSVDFSTVDGTASSISDFTSTNGTLIFNPGETNKVLMIPVNGNTNSEPDKTFFVALTNPTNAVLLTNQATGTILNDDNKNPTLASIPDLSVNELSTLIHTNSATNSSFSTEPLTYALDTSAPEGAQIDSQTGVFSWTPTETQGPGTYSVTVRVIEGGEIPKSDAKTFSITVNEVNSAPVLDAISNRVVHAGSLVSFLAAAADSDFPTNVLTFDLETGAPSGASIQGTNGLFTWVTSDSDIGTNLISVRVTDDGVPNLGDSQPFTVIVVPPPTIHSYAVDGSGFCLTWTAIPGNVYRVQYKNTIEGSWSDLPGNITASDSTASICDSSGLSSERYYRVLLVE
jgi:Fungalysin metallopeptidase (M36)/Calx-beta domain/Putative Ig domain/Fungalysin/Thermolysin Propeptide Motif